MKLTLTLLLTLAFLTLPGSAQDQTVSVPELETLEKEYATLVKTADGQHLAAVAELDKKYIARLEQTKQTAQLAGKLDEALAIDEDVKSFSSGNGVPVEVDAKTPPMLKQMHAIYRAEIAKLEVARVRNHNPLRDDYASKLDALVMRFTKDGKLKEAMTVRKLRQSLPASAASAAQPQETKPTASPVFGELVLSGTQKEDDVTIGEGQKCVIKGDYVVPSNKALNINAGAELTFERNSSLSVSGIINAIGTLDKPILFKGRGPLSSFWVGIILTSSDKSVVSFAHISEAASGIKTIGCKPMIDNCVFRNNEVGVTAGASSSPNIENCLIEKNKGNGVTIEWSASAVVRKCTITENRGKGVLGGLYCGFDIAETRIEKNKSGGVESRHGKVGAKDCVISDNGEFDIFNDGPHEWDFSGNYFGLKITAVLRSKGDTAKIAAIKGTVRLNNFLSEPPASCGYKPQARK